LTQTIGARIRLLLVDDHTLFRESLRRLLESEPRLLVVGDFPSAGQALGALREGLQFDAALVDYDLSLEGEIAGNGLEFASRLRMLRPQVNVLMVTAGMSSQDLVRAVRELGLGVFLKSEPTAELLLAIERTARGEQWISSRAALALIAEKDSSEERRADRGPLTERESEVLKGVLEGKTNKEIGAELNLTESAVKAVLQKLFEKTGVRSRSQLVRYAIETQMEDR